MKRFLVDFRVMSHEFLLVIWITVITSLGGAIIFSCFGDMAPYDGLMWLATLVSLAWAIWASFPPKEE